MQRAHRLLLLLAVLGACAAEEELPSVTGAPVIAALPFSGCDGIEEPRLAPPPPHASFWSWPNAAEFEEHCRRLPTQAWSPGVVIGYPVPAAGVEPEPEVIAVRWDEAGNAAFDHVNTPHVCRNAQLPLEPIVAGDPETPGRIILGYGGRAFEVLAATSRQPLAPEDWRDWAYARSLIDSGEALAEANRRSAEDDADLSCGESAAQECWDRASQRRVARESEFANACFDAGLIACYLVGRLGIVHDGARWPDVRRAGLPVGVDVATLRRSPVDLVRFFTGLLIDIEFGERAAFPRACADDDPSVWVAVAIADAGQSDLVASVLHHRAQDPARDPWTRARMVSLLLALQGLERTQARDSNRRNVPRDIAWSATQCALAVVASRGWSVEQAYSRCVDRPREAARWRVVAPSRARQAERALRDRDMSESVAFLAKTAAEHSP